MLSQTFAFIFLAASLAVATPLTARENGDGQRKICHNLKTQDRGCVRCKYALSQTAAVRCRHNPNQALRLPLRRLPLTNDPSLIDASSDTKGFDVTGVVTEVDLTFPVVKNECDCIQQCLDRPTTCATYVYKFSTPASVQSGHRTCTLYSQFNLPSDVTLAFDLASQNNKNINGAQITANGNNPQAGGLVPQAFKDANLDTVPDHDAVSG
jgi:hypothetical protein